MSKTPEDVKLRMQEVIADFNQNWRSFYQEHRIKLIFELSNEANEFLTQFEVTGSYPIYGTLLYGKIKDKPCILKLDHNEGYWQVGYNGNKSLQPIRDAFVLSKGQEEKFEAFLDHFDFNIVINALKIAERKDVVDDRRSKYKGRTITDFVMKGDSVRVVLDNGESFAYSDFLGFKGHLKSVLGGK
jgi:hypothetical protein